MLAHWFLSPFGPYDPRVPHINLAAATPRILRSRKGFLAARVLEPAPVPFHVSASQGALVKILLVAYSEYHAFKELPLFC
jgi:hypothetical protein